jgi:hypothetical protein
VHLGRSQQGFNACGELSVDIADLGNHWLELMRCGDFEEAWRVSDAITRAHAGVDCRNWPRHRQLVWDGTPLENKRVLVRCYHGLGDTIQYARLLAPASAIAREIILWAQAPLLPLLETVPGSGKVLPLHDGEPDVERDVDIEIAELAHALRITPASLALQIPYVHIGSAPRLRSDRLVVGLVWAAGEWDARRSIPVELLAPLAGIAGIHWEVLQRGPARAQWCHKFAEAAHISDIVEEARRLMALDLLVTVDTCSAHLAGALGVPVWTLLHADPDWRWMRERSDTFWYPTMRLFRQSRAGDWASVMVQVSEALQGLRRWSTQCEGSWFD